HKMPLTYSKQPFVSNKEATKGRYSKAPTGFKIGHSKKRKESSSAIDSNPSQPLVSTHVDTGIHKEDQQATGGITSLKVTSKARANPQLSSGMSTFKINEPIYLTSSIIHSESSSGNDASAAEANPGICSPSDFVPQQQGMNEGTKNTLYDHLFAGNDASTAEADPGICSPSDFVPQKQGTKLGAQSGHKKPLTYSKQPFVSNKEATKGRLPVKQEPTLSSVVVPTYMLLQTKPNLLVNDWKLSPHSLSHKKGPTQLLVKLRKKPPAQPSWKILLRLSLVSEDTSSTKRLLLNRGGAYKERQGKKALSSEEAIKESTESDSDDDETHLSEFMVESYRIKKVKKFDFVTKDGKHIHLTEEQINQQKKIEEEAKAEAAKRDSEDFVTIEDFRDFSNTMVYTVQEIFFRLHQGPRLDDHARTFSFLLLAEINKRNLNPLKQMRVIEQLRQ
nr:hypothetical protein [Tanacetum cinerariifolium]